MSNALRTHYVPTTLSSTKPPYNQTRMFQKRFLLAGILQDKTNDEYDDEINGDDEEEDDHDEEMDIEDGMSLNFLEKSLQNLSIDDDTYINSA